MKRFFNILAVAALALVFSTSAFAGSPRDLTVKSIFEFPVGNPVAAAGDYTLFWDNSARTFVRIDASTAPVTNRQAQGTVLSGQTSIAIPLTGVTTSSRCQVTQHNVATNSVYLRGAVPTTNTVTVTVSADPGAGGQIVNVLCVN